MPLKLTEESGPEKISLNYGKLRRPRNQQEDLTNEVGIQLELDTKNGVLEGKILVHKVGVSIKTREELQIAIENFFNKELKAKL